MPITDRHIFYPVLSKSHLRPALNNSILSAYALRIPPNQRPFCHHCNFSSPSIERADRAAYAEGVVPPLPRRARAVPGTEAGQGVQGA